MADVINIYDEQDPFPEEVAVASPQVPKEVSDSAGIISASAVPAEAKAQVYTETTQKFSFDRYAYAQEMADKKRQQDMEAVVQYADVMSQDGTPVDEAVDNIKIATEEVDARASSPLAPYFKMVDDVAPADMPPGERDEKALSMYAADLLIEVAKGSQFDSKWTLDDITQGGPEVAGLLFNPLQTDLSQIGIHNWPAFVSAFQARDPVEKAAMLSEIKAELDRVNTSTIKKISILDTLTDIANGKTLATVDTAFDAMTIGALVGNVVKGVSGVTRLAKLRKTLEAAALNKAAMTNEQALASLNISHTTAVDNAQFWPNMNLLNPEAIPDSHKIADAQMKLNVQDLSESAETFRTKFMAEVAAAPMLDTAVAAKSRMSATEQIQKAEDFVTKKLFDKYNVTAGEIETPVVEMLDGGKVRVTARVAGKSKQKVTKTMTLGETVVGTYDAVADPSLKTLGVLDKTFLNSPRSLFEDAVGKNTMVNDTSQLFLNNTKLHTVFSHNWADVFTPISKDGKVAKDSWNRVEAALVASDRKGGPGATGHRYSPWELQAGVPTEKGTMFLTKPEQETYYRYYEYVDTIGYFKNAAERELMVRDGMRSVRAGDHAAFGKPLAAGDAENLIKSADADTEILLPDGSIGKLADVKLDDTKTIVHVSEEIHTPSGNFPLIVVDTKNITDLPAQVLARRNAYTPVVRQGTNFIIREHTAGKVMGKVVPVNPAAALDPSIEVGGANVRTHTLHSSKSLAMEEFNRLQAAIPEDKRSAITYTFREEADAHYTGRQPLVPRKGVGRSARASRDVTAGAGVNAPETLPVIEATQKYTSIMARDIALGQWRYNHMKMLEAQYNKLVPPKDGKAWKFGMPMEDGPHLKEFKARVEYTKSIINAKTIDESIWEKQMLRLGNFIDSFGTQPARGVGKFINNLSHADPIAATRTATYHTKLGMFNPGQLLVQSTNVAIAASMHPVEVAKTLGDYVAVRYVMNIKNPIARQAFIKQAVERKLVSPAFAERFKRFDKTGIEYAATNNPDMAMMAVNLPEDSSAFKKLSHISTVFVREGETFSQIMGWLVADELAQTGKLGKGLKGDDLLRATADKQRLFTMNISKANRAAYEEHKTMRFATQFVGVSTKFAEMWLPKSAGGTAAFTSAEKFKIFFGQMALFGLVGTTATEVATQAYLAATGQTYQDLDEKEIRALEAGAIGFIFPDSALSERVNLIPNLEDAYFAAMEGDADMLSMALGASESTLKQSFKALKAITAFSVDLAGDKGYNRDKMELSVREVARMASSYTAWEKSYIMSRHNMLVQRSTGEVIFWNPTTAEVLTQAFGVSTAREADFYRSAIYDSRKKRLRDKFVKELIKDFHEAELYSNEPEADKYNIALHQIQAKAALYTGGDPYDTNDLMNAWRAQIRAGKQGKMESSAAKWIRNDFKSMVDTIQERKDQLKAENFIEVTTEDQKQFEEQ